MIAKTMFRQRRPVFVSGLVFLVHEMFVFLVPTIEQHDGRSCKEGAQFRPAGTPGVIQAQKCGAHIACMFCAFSEGGEFRGLDPSTPSTGGTCCRVAVDVKCW